MDAEIITQKNGLFPLQGRPKRPVSSGPPARAERRRSYEKSTHRPRHRQTTGGAILCTGPTATALTPAKCDGGASIMLPNGYHQPAGSAQSPLGSSGIAETGLHVDGFSIVVRVFPKYERERARLIREARAIYDSIFSPADPVSEKQNKAPINHTLGGANAHRSDGSLLS
jgi:hypothetical protein